MWDLGTSQKMNLTKNGIKQKKHTLAFTFINHVMDMNAASTC